MKVTLREKKLKEAKRSLYLDFYPPITRPDTGKPTRREFLSLYVFDKPKTETERDHNKETRILAENVRAKRQFELQAGNYGFLVKKRQNTDFLKYFRDLADKRGKSQSMKQIWESSILYLTDFTNGQCTIENLSQKFVEDFKTYLLNAPSRRSKDNLLKPSSASAYFQCFCSTLNQAVKDGLLPVNPAADVEKIKTLEANREYLTIEELQKLAATECRLPDILRRAALFSALTGLRFSDIQKLKWENIRYSEKMGYYLQFRIKKTGENLTLPISDEARSLLGGQTAPGEQVLSGLSYGSIVNIHIARWTLSAGISKTITFHSFRHTFATAQLTLGTDLYTVSKMLGHKSIEKTQIYARIVDEKKREAANKLKLG